jgi:hypothetical protein
MPRTPAIRCIVQTLSSVRDVNGNSYHVAIFYCPAKGRHARVRLEVGGPSNARGIALKYVGGDYEKILSLEQTIPKREWQNYRRNPDIMIEGFPEADAAMAKLFGKAKP